MGEAFIVRRGGGTSLNFRVLGGTAQPASPRENDIWVNTDQNITSWNFGAEEPNVYEIKEKYNQSWWDIPCHLSEGDIVNFITPVTMIGDLTDLNLVDASGKIFVFREYGGGALKAWYSGTLLGFRISYDRNPIGDSPGYDGTAYLASWGFYYHEEGTAWFGTSNFSSVPFNALKKNGVVVYPVSAQQYIGDAWERMNAYIFQSGEWVQFSSEIPPWDGTIYRNGTEETITTGGLTQKPNVVMNSGHSNDSKIEKKADRIVFGPAGSGGALLTTVNKVDLTSYNTLTFKGSGSGHAGVHDFESGSIRDGAVYGTIGSNTSLDISELTGLYYITFGAYNTDNTYTCTEAYVS